MLGAAGALAAAGGAPRGAAPPGPAPAVAPLDSYVEGRYVAEAYRQLQAEGAM
jgi:hypothetical protein